MYQLNGTLVFCPQSRTLSNGAIAKVLTNNTSRFLELLITNNGMYVDKKTLMHQIWHEQGIIVSDVSVRQTLHHLRKVLGEFSCSGDFIQTLRGKGYAISPQCVERLNEQVLMLPENADMQQKLPALADKYNKSALRNMRVSAVVFSALLCSTLLIFFYKVFFYRDSNYTLAYQTNQYKFYSAKSDILDVKEIERQVEAFRTVIKPHLADVTVRRNVYIQRNGSHNAVNYAICHALQTANSPECKRYALINRF
ncbi:hypothetical protein CIG19_06380 [Enterobacterales bacterium CwR94]|nr:hypothetical protein CIG19_06380 [Enterobacterales bacterium CwR94]